MNVGGDERTITIAIECNVHDVKNSAEFPVYKPASSLLQFLSVSPATATATATSYYFNSTVYNK